MGMDDAPKITVAREFGKVNEFEVVDTRRSPITLDLPQRDVADRA
ncbi:hypothetical protein ADILRU_0982 [Leifsonia rubra CMS 76R]|nr:hypothetical protein ADILRU_0982 [Leifsonia rubra CMS 76R]